jgi:hypothetical protein
MSGLNKSLRKLHLSAQRNIARGNESSAKCIKQKAICEFVDEPSTNNTPVDDA